MAGVAKTKGRKPTKEEHEKLRRAVFNGDVEYIKKLASSRVDVNADVFPPYNQTPLHYAAENNQLETIKVLHEYGADINCQTESSQ
ncbi:ankyrin repeat, SAM and basic leucine zipper domain-containing protein 1-like [Dysidea avara]|uniref:ankyrin repeat, SAM and basic leucine zipper domain-containing protein 1-like n=1 Tax=Dysidea avara TaxID=196820 RepID=UPI0033285497